MKHKLLMMKTLYFDCFAGASGNMILGALVALGVDENKLVEQIRLLNVADFEIEFKTVDRSGISAVFANVKVPDEKAHRHLHNIEKIINESNLSKKVKHNATKIFRSLAQAEAKVHGIEVEKVHFHEVGALDAIIDVVGSCIGFELLEIENFACSKIHVGSGFVQMQHGKFPIPPPAVAELLRQIPVYSTEIEGELITPTGAAIVSALCESFGNMPELKIEKNGYGAGSRNYKDFPNALRLILGETASDNLKKGESNFDNEIKTETLTLLETNLDDVSPQILGFFMERAFEIGALDCWFTPIQMKKNRPAVKVSVLCNENKKRDLTDLIFRETTTLGVRVSQIERNCLPREVVKVETEFGEIDVKIARYKGKIINAQPEFETVKKAALKFNVSIQTINKAAKLKFVAANEIKS